MTHLPPVPTLVPAPSVAILPQHVLSGSPSRKSIWTLWSTRPEVIKLAPVIHALERREDSFRTVNVASGQQADLVHPVLKLFAIRVDENLEVMKPNQTPSLVCA